MNCKKCGYNLSTSPSFIFCPSCGTPSAKKDELQVEHYDTAEAEAKKRRILFKVSVGVSAAALLALLGAFGLINLGWWLGWWTTAGASLGGAGAWFNSRVIFLEAESG